MGAVPTPRPRGGLLGLLAVWLGGVGSGGFAYLVVEGAGEEAIPDVTCAIYNAIFKITGKRIRSLPFGGQDLSWA